jgi:hypothetical protein
VTTKVRVRDYVVAGIARDARPAPTVDRYGGAVKLGVEGCREICVRGGGGGKPRQGRQGQSTGKTERANDVGGEGSGNKRRRTGGHEAESCRVLGRSFFCWSARSVCSILVGKPSLS